ncbi:LysR family transcriptional regulator [Brenneria corticis]|uniref:LysR family transcriptional regulator n=1 Tax=Brenneria corticis TaxID=2173106 RepID=A0A2U1TZ09_9GAMM|nr:LysR family transcriptional regulator [Brenneria sp. CFCC 11842]PWC14647.1 LysR family transcriptional regulator [Brenneria sp. CFCC 11842]
MHLDLRQLRNFLALVEQKSFVQAADAVYLSQSAFSRSIQALEQAVGCQLIERQSKQFALTWQGERLLPLARRMQELSGELLKDMRHMSDEQGGHLFFGCGPAPSSMLIPQALANFHRQRPGVRIAYSVDNWQSLHQRLIADEFSFFVADIWQAEINPELRVQPLRSQRCFFVCHQTHPLAGQDSVTPAQLLSYPFAAPYLPTGIRKVLAALSQQPDFTPHIQCDYICSLFGVLRHSNAISFVSEDTFLMLQKSHGLVGINLTEVPPEWAKMRTHFGIISPMNKPLPPLAQLMVDTIIDTDRERNIFELDACPAGSQRQTNFPL